MPHPICAKQETAAYLKLWGLILTHVILTRHWVQNSSSWDALQCDEPTGATPGREGANIILEIKCSCIPTDCLICCQARYCYWWIKSPTVDDKEEFGLSKACNITPIQKCINEHIIIVYQWSPVASWYRCYGNVEWWLESCWCRWSTEQWQAPTPHCSWWYCTHR